MRTQFSTDWKKLKCLVTQSVRKAMKPPPAVSISADGSLAIPFYLSIYLSIYLSVPFYLLAYKNTVFLGIHSIDIFSNVHNYIKTFFSAAKKNLKHS